MSRRVALIGLGEVGSVFARDLRGAGVDDIRCWDTAFADPGSKASRSAAELGPSRAASSAEAVAGADLVVSAVTAAHCTAAAQDAAPHLAPGAWFFDLNSASPGNKTAAARCVDDAGARYVEVALMSPIEPRRLAAPFLLGGPHAAGFHAVAPTWGISQATIASDTVGRAAATKLCRSVIVKGLESLMSESLVAARGYGVEREVLDSLSNILPEADWGAIAQYFIGRSVQHGVRRAEEMEQAAATVAEAGVDPWMSGASVERQRWAASFAGPVPAALDDLLDMLRGTSRTDAAAHPGAGDRP